MLGRYRSRWRDFPAGTPTRGSSTTRSRRRSPHRGPADGALPWHSAPARAASPSFSDIALWEIHEAFAAQVLANVAAITDRGVRATAGVQAAMGDFDWDRASIPMEARSPWVIRSALQARATSARR